MNLSDFLKIQSPTVLGLLKDKLDPRLSYHNCEHTIDVMEQAFRIGQAEGLDNEELIMLRVAALYHDTGFLRERKNHEQQSVIFFKDHAEGKLEESIINEVAETILATCMPQKPSSLIQKVLCDADLDYLGRSDFQAISDKLFQEISAFDEVHSKTEWDKIQVQFLNGHHYHTNSQRELREAKKMEHLSAIIDRIG